MSDSVAQSFLRVPLPTVDRIGEADRIREAHDQDRSAARHRKKNRRNPFPEEENLDNEKLNLEESPPVEKAFQKQDAAGQEGPGLVIDITV